jgi:hypothetical protein
MRGRGLKTIATGHDSSTSTDAPCAQPGSGSSGPNACTPTTRRSPAVFASSNAVTGHILASRAASICSSRRLRSTRSCSSASAVSSLSSCFAWLHGTARRSFQCGSDSARAKPSHSPGTTSTSTGPRSPSGARCAGCRGSGSSSTSPRANVAPVPSRSPDRGRCSAPPAAGAMARTGRCQSALDGHRLRVHHRDWHADPPGRPAARGGR